MKKLFYFLLTKRMGKFRKSRLRKGVSIVASMVLLLNSIMPTVPVFAEDPCEGHPVCVNNVGYETLSDAIAVVEAGATIELSAGTYELDKVSFTKNVTIKGTEDVIIEGPKVCTDGNSNHISDGNAKAGTIDSNVTVTFEDVILDLGNGDCAGQGFAGDHENSKVIIKDSTVKGRLTTFTNMEFDTVTFINTPSYNVDVHKGSKVEFTGCIFSGTNRNINVYDWNNDGSANHDVAFTNCTFKTSSNTANKGAINIHESHANQAYAVKYNVNVTNADIENGTYPTNKEVIWYESNASKGKGYFSKIVAEDGLVSIDDIRRVIATEGGEITVTVDENSIYSTPETSDAGVTADTTEELNAIKDWYTSNGYTLTALENAGEDKYSVQVATYAITFVDENNQAIGEVQNLGWNAEVQAPNVDNKDADETCEAYEVIWTPAIHNVTGAQEYVLSYNCTTPHKYTVIFDNKGHGTAPMDITNVEYGAKITEPAALTENGWTFGGWYKESALTHKWNFTSDTVTGHITLYAKWTKKTTGGGGGSSSYECRSLPTNAIANNSTKPSKNTDYSYSTDTSKVCTFQCKSGYTRNEKNSTCDKVEEQIQQNTTGDAKNDSKVEDSNTKDNVNNSWYEEGNQSEILSNGYTREFKNAYVFAYKNGITTMNTIEKANMNGGLTRIAMAKMLSQYAINVLGKKPANVVVPQFNDVSSQLNEQYGGAVTLAYQLGIMGINMPNNNFRPFDTVTRAEFATALSRMLFGIADGRGAYYETYMKKLMEQGIITVANPSLEERRGYVMIMLMRSAM